uniref:Putative endonuclease n=1 Tax=Ixodes ricinus TaxID=34613 RepID=A0A0K8R3Z9_IXORI
MKTMKNSKQPSLRDVVVEVEVECAVEEVEEAIELRDHGGTSTVLLPFMLPENVEVADGDGRPVKVHPFFEGLEYGGIVALSSCCRIPAGLTYLRRAIVHVSSKSSSHSLLCSACSVELHCNIQDSTAG